MEVMYGSMEIYLNSVTELLLYGSFWSFWRIGKMLRHELLVGPGLTNLLLDLRVLSIRRVQQYWEKRIRNNLSVY